MALLSKYCKDRIFFRWPILWYREILV